MSEQVPANPASPRASEQPNPFRLRAGTAVGLAIVAVAAVGLGFFYARGLTNLYGDGIAHMEGARRLTDSLTPGYGEIGTVWLPLYHLLVAPLAINNSLWRTGLGGSLISSAAFAVAAWFVYRMAAAMNRNLASGVVALAAFLLCPSMMYLASTPLTEPLMVMWTVVTVYGLFRFQETGKRRALLAASVAAFLGTLTRYDGWFLLPFAALFVLLARREPLRKRLENTVIFCAIAGAGPALWFLHNAVRFGNPLEFYNGPFSAQAIYARQLATTGFRYPTDGSLLISARYFLADLAIVIGPWVLELAVLGLAMWALDVRERRRRSAALLLLVPFVFYVQSMAHAAVALYVPTLFPHTYYNLRYGIEMLPAAAIFPSLLITSRISPRARQVLLAVIVAIFLGQTISQFSSGVRDLPVVKESLLNTPCKSPEEKAVIEFFRTHYDGGRILVALGGWPCLMPEVGIPFHKTVTEANRKIWKQLPEDPGKWVEWILRGKDDSVDELMRAYPGAFSCFEMVEREQFPQGQWFEIYRRKSP